MFRVVQDRLNSHACIPVNALRLLPLFLVKIEHLFYQVASLELFSNLSEQNPVIRGQATYLFDAPASIELSISKFLTT